MRAERLEAPGANRRARVFVEVLESRGLLNQDVLLHTAIGADHEVERHGALDRVVLRPFGVGGHGVGENRTVRDRTRDGSARDRAPGRRLRASRRLRRLRRVARLRDRGQRGRRSGAATRERKRRTFAPAATAHGDGARETRSRRDGGRRGPEEGSRDLGGSDGRAGSLGLLLHGREAGLEPVLECPAGLRIRLHLRLGGPSHEVGLADGLPGRRDLGISRRGGPGTRRGRQVASLDQGDLRDGIQDLRRSTMEEEQEEEERMGHHTHAHRPSRAKASRSQIDAKGRGGHRAPSVRCRVAIARRLAPPALACSSRRRTAEYGAPESARTTTRTSSFPCWESLARR